MCRPYINRCRDQHFPYVPVRVSAPALHCPHKHAVDVAKFLKFLVEAE